MDVSRKWQSLAEANSLASEDEEREEMGYWVIGVCRVFLHMSVRLSDML